MQLTAYPSDHLCHQSSGDEGRWIERVIAGSFSEILGDHALVTATEKMERQLPMNVMGQSELQVGQ